MMRIVLSSVILVILLVIVQVYAFWHEKHGGGNVKSGGACSATGCSALDPVSDPAYNIKQIAKQSILLEEHIAEKQKRCRDCIAKHFLHIIGLAEEAVWLAHRNFSKYPYLENMPAFYDSLFNRWLRTSTQSQPEQELQAILILLRDQRKKIIAKYYFDDNSSTEH
jgi:hypothetical protein